MQHAGQLTVASRGRARVRERADEYRHLLRNACRREVVQQRRFQDAFAGHDEGG